MPIGSKFEAPNDAKGLPWLRAMGHPLLWDGKGKNLGVTNNWVTLFDLSAYGDRIFTGIELYNPSSTISIYVAFEPAAGSESKILIVETQSSLSIDEITFGPGFMDPVTGKIAKLIRAIAGSSSGTAASGTITYTTKPTDGNQVSINGTNNYIFVSALDGRASAAATYFNLGTGVVQVLIGATKDTAYTNLVAAIIANDLTLTASVNTGTGVVTVTCLFSGTGGNSDVFADGTSATGSTFSGSGTLASGSNTGAILVDAHIW
jgi:hypothetical protein